MSETDKWWQIDKEEEISITKMDVHTCTICSKEFSSDRALKQHNRDKHGHEEEFKNKKGIMGPNQNGRITNYILGAFLFFFGLPFTLVPFMMLSDGVIDPDYPFESLFMIVFSIPFLMAGLFVQWIGLRVMRGTMEWWKGSVESGDLDFWERHDHL
tara:strand:+ start:155 stop:622 length:468 start_codon:yes stop_codon:yes gene_type:complete